MSVQTLSRRERALAIAIAVALLAALLPANLWLRAEAVTPPPGANVTRYAGQTRAETAAKVALAVGPANTAILVRSDEFADALSASILYAATGAPILFTGRDSIPQATFDVLGTPGTATATSLGVNDVIVVGGELVVSESVITELTNAGFATTRLSGQDRFETAAAVVGAAVPDLDSAPTTVLIASGRSFPDGLVGGALAAGAGLPLLLTEKSALPEATKVAIEGMGELTDAIVLGGPNVVGSEVVAALDTLGLNIKRLGGTNRQDTAALVSAHAIAELGFSPAAPLLAVGNVAADALVVGPLAGKKKSTILLTGTATTLTPRTEAALQEMATCDTRDLLIPGGTAAVSEDVAAAAAAALGTHFACDIAVTPFLAGTAIGAAQEFTAAVTNNVGIPVDVDVTFTAMTDPLATAAVSTPFPADPQVVTATGGQAKASLNSLTPGTTLVLACVPGQGEGAEPICGDGAVQHNAEFDITLSGANEVNAIGDSNSGDPDAAGTLHLGQLPDGTLCIAGTVTDAATPGTETVLGAGAAGAAGTVEATLPGMDANGVIAGCGDVSSILWDTLLTSASGFFVSVRNAEYTGTAGAPGNGAGAARGQLVRRGLDVSSWTPASAGPVIPDPVSGVTFVTNVPETNGVSSMNFIDYGTRNVMVAIGSFGVKTIDVTDPTAPVELDQYPLLGMRSPEDLEIDQERKLAFMARDPRSFGGSASEPSGASGIYVFDLKDPADIHLITFHDTPAGHTTSCVNGCQAMWTGGPAKPSNYPEEWGGRPLWVTDLSDPYHPVTSPLPIDLERNDGVTDYVHDVQVDDSGIAWVSGGGGVRGYHTSGFHFDPVLEIHREATAFDPVPAGGGGIDAFPSAFSHNSARPIGASKDDGADLSLGYEEGELLYVTEESFTGGCVTDGLFGIVRVTGSEDGQGWRSTPEDPYRLETVGTWSPVGEPGSSGGLCSAHYFDMKAGLVVYSWYQYGTRFVDVSDPTNPIQVGYFTPPGNNSFSPYFNGSHVYIGDSSRGIDIVTVNATMQQNRQTRTAVELPVASLAVQAERDATLAQFAPDPAYGWACRILLS